MKKLTLLPLPLAIITYKALWTCCLWLLAWRVDWCTDKQHYEIFFFPRLHLLLGLRVFQNKTSFCFSNIGPHSAFSSSHACTSWGQSNPLTPENEESWSKLQTKKTWSYLAQLALVSDLSQYPVSFMSSLAAFPWACRFLISSHLSLATYIF